MALAAGALLAGGLAAFGASAASAITPPEGPGPWFVNTATGNDANSCLSPTQACKTIKQALVDEGTGNPGTASQDIINVAPGTDSETGPISTAADNTGVSIIGAGQSLKKKKHGTIVAPSGTCTPALLNLSAGTTINVSDLVVSGGLCSGQSEGILTGSGDSITKTTILAAAPIGVEIPNVATAISSSTIGSSVSCSTKAVESSSGTLITVSKIPKCARGFTAITAGSGNTPDSSSAIQLNKFEIQTAIPLVIDNGNTIYFNTTPYGYSSIGINCVGPAANCDLTDNDVIGGGTYLAGAIGIDVTGGAMADVFGNSVSGNADSTPPSGGGAGTGVGINVVASPGTNTVNIGKVGANEGNTLAGNDTSIEVASSPLLIGVGAQSVNVINNSVTSGSANRGGGVVVALVIESGVPASSNVTEVTVQHNSISQGAAAQGGGIVVEGTTGVTFGGTDVNGPAGNSVSSNGLGIVVTDYSCAIGSVHNTITNNSVTNNSLFGIDVNGQASMPELSTNNTVCGSDLNNLNNISDNVVTGNGTFGNSLGVYGADIIDFSNYQAMENPSNQYQFSVEPGTQLTGCSSSSPTPCTWDATVFDASFAPPGEKIPEGTQFTIGTCTATSGSCITAFTAATASGFQTISNNPLAPSTLVLTGEGSQLSSLTTPVTGVGSPFTNIQNNFQVTLTNAAPNTYTANTCTNGDAAPGTTENALTSHLALDNFESNSAVLNTTTGTAPYDAC